MVGEVAVPSVFTFLNSNSVNSLPAFHKLYPNSIIKESNHSTTTTPEPLSMSAHCPLTSESQVPLHTVPVPPHTVSKRKMPS